MRLIDEDAFDATLRDGEAKALNMHNTKLSSFIQMIRGNLRKAPTVEPEIVLCKECKWYEGDIMGNPWGVCCHDSWTSGNIGHEVSESGWCYRRERRTDATD